MPNQSSHAQHIPERMCVICRNKKAQIELLHFVKVKGEIVFDYKRKIRARGYYCCDDNACIKRLEKWNKKH